MQRQRKFIIFGVIAILVLAGATTYYKANQNRWQYMMGIGGGYSSSPAPMMYDAGFGGYGGTMMKADSFVENRMAIEPMPVDSMLYPYYGDDLGLDADYRMYDRSANYDVIVKDVQTYLRSMREYVLSIGGVVLNDSFNQSSDWKAGSLYVKVPMEKFSEAGDRAVEGVKEVYSSSSYASDITGSHVSATSRVETLMTQIANTKASLEASQALLARAQEGSAEWRQYRSEVLQLENRLATLERQLEQLQKNVENIENQAEYGTLTIAAADSKRYFDPNGNLPLFEQLLRALESLGSSGYVIASFLIWVAVYSVIWLPILGVYLWFTRRAKSKQ